MKGFKNNGSICYFNSLIQCLLNLQNFRKFILNNDDNYIKEFLLTEEHDDLFTIKLLIKIDAYLPNQSPSEYLMFLIEKFNMDKIFEKEYAIERVCSECNFYTKSDDKTEVGLVQEFSELFLCFSKIEDVNCSNCKSRVTLNEKRSLKKINDAGIIVICLNKYTEKKIVEYPIQFIVNDETYKLKGTIEHYGTLEGGHYNCRILKDGICYFIDDSSVSETVFSVSENTYMLFYEKEI